MSLFNSSNHRGQTEGGDFAKRITDTLATIGNFLGTSLISGRILALIALNYFISYKQSVHATTMLKSLGGMAFMSENVIICITWLGSLIATSIPLQYKLYNKDNQIDNSEKGALIFTCIMVLAINGWLMSLNYDIISLSPANEILKGIYLKISWGITFAVLLTDILIGIFTVKDSKN